MTLCEYIYKLCINNQMSNISSGEPLALLQGLGFYVANARSLSYLFLTALYIHLCLNVNYFYKKCYNFQLINNTFLHCKNKLYFSVIIFLLCESLLFQRWVPKFYLNCKHGCWNVPRMVSYCYNFSVYFDRKLKMATTA